jgi:hypothetical protein
MMLAMLLPTSRVERILLFLSIQNVRMPHRLDSTRCRARVSVICVRTVSVPEKKALARRQATIPAMSAQGTARP